MKIEEAIAKLEEYECIYDQFNCNIQPSEVKAIGIVLNELEEQTEANKELNKVIITYKAMINEMAKYIHKKDNGDIYDIACTEECENTKCMLAKGDNEYQELECIKEYFYKKVKSNKETQ